MKRALSSRILTLLLAPLVAALLLLLLPWGPKTNLKPTSAATPVPPSGTLQIGFIDSPSAGFQEIALSIYQVRVNPSTNPEVSDSDNNWYTIYPAPEVSGVGASMQLNFNNIQAEARLLNTVKLPEQVYNQIEVIFLDDPGVIVPSCTGAPLLEGCIAYGLTITSGSELRVSAPVPVTVNSMTQLILELNPTVLTPPSEPGGSYQMSPTLSVVSSNQYLGQVRGTVSGFTSYASTLVSAVVSGTSNIVAQVPVTPSGSFAFGLPAPIGGSATYDLFATGPGVGFDAYSALPISNGIAAPAVNLSVSPATVFGNIGGTVTDSANNPLGGALVELLVPASNNSGADCLSTPTQCVVVASTNATPGNGSYTFAHVLTVPFPANGPSYTLRASYSGHDPELVTVNAPTSNGGTVTCSPSTNPGNCSFALTSATITGLASVQVAPPPGTDVEFVVIAEETGTQNIVGSTLFPVVIPAGQTSAAFSIDVPTKPGVYDLVATTLDFYQQIDPSTFTGHNLLTATGVPADTSGLNLGTFDCVGHASIAGTAVSPIPETAIQVSKCAPLRPGESCTAPACTIQSSSTPGCLVDVQQSAVAPSLAANAGQFSFCLPPDQYTVTRIDNGVAASPTTVVVPTPAPISTPCPTVCQGPGPGCPGVCSTTNLGNLSPASGG